MKIIFNNFNSILINLSIIRLIKYKKGVHDFGDKIKGLYCIGELLSIYRDNNELIIINDAYQNIKENLDFISDGEIIIEFDELVVQKRKEFDQLYGVFELNRISLVNLGEFRIERVDDDGVVAGDGFEEPFSGLEDVLGERLVGILVLFYEFDDVVRDLGESGLQHVFVFHVEVLEDFERQSGLQQVGGRLCEQVDEALDQQTQHVLVARVDLVLVVVVRLVEQPGVDPATHRQFGLLE